MSLYSNLIEWKCALFVFQKIKKIKQRLLYRFIIERAHDVYLFLLSKITHTHTHTHTEHSNQDVMFCWFFVLFFVFFLNKYL
jgi:hypothetical protein